MNKKSFIKKTFAILFLLAVLAIWLGFGDRGFIHLQRMEEERQAYIEKIKQIEKENNKLLEEIDRLKNDNEYIESIARKELGLVKDDEIIYRIDKTDKSSIEQNDRKLKTRR